MKLLTQLKLCTSCLNFLPCTASDSRSDTLFESVTALEQTSGYQPGLIIDVVQGKLDPNSIYEEAHGSYAESLPPMREWNGSTNMGTSRYMRIGFHSTARSVRQAVLSRSRIMSPSYIIIYRERVGQAMSWESQYYWSYVDPHEYVYKIYGV